MLFITFGLERRRPVFGHVLEGKLIHSAAGLAAQEVLQREMLRNPDLTVRSSVIMPDHVHLRIHVRPGAAEPLKAVGQFVNNFKRWSKWKVAKLGIALDWQANYHDRLCLSAEVIDLVDKYIANNPLKWWLMHGDRSLLHVREPLAESWLPPDAFWRCVGRFEPQPGRKLVALRISRRIPEREMPGVVENCVKGALRGYCYVSTFFSPGEHAVYRAVAERTEAPMIHLRADEIAWAYRPTGLEPELFAAGRLLALARMEATDAPADRATLLWLNDKAR